MTNPRCQSVLSIGYIASSMLCSRSKSHQLHVKCFGVITLKDINFRAKFKSFSFFFFAAFWPLDKTSSQFQTLYCSTQKSVWLSRSILALVRQFRYHSLPKSSEIRGVDFLNELLDTGLPTSRIILLNQSGSISRSQSVYNARKRCIQNLPQ
jgi:hypothetical protein